MYSVYLSFIRQYCRFYSSNAQVDQRLLNLIQTELRELLSTIFQPIDLKLILSLCRNFPAHSYFHLHSEMSKVELNHRLRALNVAALVLSTYALAQSTQLSSTMSDKCRHPMSVHLQSACLLSFVINVLQNVDGCSILRTVVNLLLQFNVHYAKKDIGT